MKAEKVKPKDWLTDENYPIRIVFESDKENYSVIWGKYKNEKKLGVRWNGITSRGYPGQGEHPTWYVEPDFLATAILQRLLTLSIDSEQTEYLDNLKFAINELTNKMINQKNGR